MAEKQLLTKKGYEERVKDLKEKLDLCMPENIDKYQLINKI